jgi:hypothetical protein
MDELLSSVAFNSNLRRYNAGYIDEMRIWSAALTSETINYWKRFELVADYFTW